MARSSVPTCACGQTEIPGHSPGAWTPSSGYLFTQGREWERYAWLKGRALPVRAFPDSDPEPNLQLLESMRQPFVYRKYFDFDALAALQRCRRRIRQDWQRKALARPGLESQHNIKLGEGTVFVKSNSSSN